MIDILGLERAGSLTLCDYTAHEGWFQQTSAEIEFPCQLFIDLHHPKPITRSHVALDKI